MKSWSCIENCGARCRFYLTEREDLTNKLTVDDLELIDSITNNYGWCKYLDKTNKKSLIYETRLNFCRVNEFSIAFKEYLRNSDKFLINCCKQHISSIYVSKSNQMKNFKKAIS